MPLYHRRAKKSIDKITKNNSEQIPKFVQNAGLTLGQGYVNIYLTKGKRKEGIKMEKFNHIITLTDIADLPVATYIGMKGRFEYWRGYKTGIIYRIAT
jgi:hypothetical protein